MRRAALASLALLLGAVMPAAAQSPATPRAAINADIRTNDPGVNRDGNTDAVMMHVLEGLVGLTEDGDVAPLLAERVAVSEDGKTYTFTLRDGIQFHNGAPVTAADVAWTWQRYLDPNTKWRCQSEFGGKGLTKIEAVETPDPRTVVFRIEKPTALFLSVMARPDCGGSGILHKDSIGADGKWKGPIATGPFKFGEWKRGEFVELERFAGYKSLPGVRDGYVGGKKAEVERVRFIVVPDPSAAKAALLAGSLDVVTDVTVDDIAELKRRGDITIDTAPTMGVNAILMQTNDPVLRDVRVRRAIASAIDSAEITTAITQDTARPNVSMVPTPSSYHGKAQAAWVAHDPALARKLLAEAGYRGQTVKILANKRYGSMYDAAVLAQAMLQQVGMKAEIEVLEWATQLDRYLKGDYQMMSFSYSARLDPALNFEMMSGPKATQPRKVWDNPEALKLLDEAMVVSDRKRRQAIFDQLHAMFVADVPMLVLYNGVDIAASGKRVKGYKGWAAGQPRFWGVALQSARAALGGSPPVLRYIIRRLLMTVPTALLVAIAVFVLLRLVPGDPAQLMLGDTATEETLAELRRQLGLDQPIPLQFLYWLGNVLKGDLGRSITNDLPVLPLLLDRFRVSATIVLAAVLLASLIAVPAGMLAAWRQNSLGDLVIVSGATLMLSIPSFWLGLLMLLLFGVKLGWLPVVGYVSFAEDPARALAYIILPITTLTLIEIGVITRMARAATIEVLRLEYITHARAKGVPELRVLWRHALPNAFAPTWTVIGLILGNLLGGIAVVETVFTLPGLGRLLVDGIFARDYPVVQGCLLFTAIMYVLVNLLVDLLYPVFDPRVTAE